MRTWTPMLIILVFLCEICRPDYALPQPTLTEEANLSNGDSYLAVCDAFYKQNWQAAYSLSANAVLSLKEDETAAPYWQVMDECRRRIYLDEKKIQLPLISQWRIDKRRLSHEEQISYLIRRIHLAKAAYFEPGPLIPDVIWDEIGDSRQEQPTQRKESEPIDPFDELLQIKIENRDLPLLIPGLRYDWSFMLPENVAVHPRIRRPGSRYCICVIINRVLGRPNAIREYQLLDEDWGDHQKVMSLINTSKNSAQRQQIKE